MQISVPVTFDATNQTMSVSDSSLITFPQNTSDFSIVTVNGIDCITPTTVTTSPTHYVQFGIASSVEETEFDAYIDISNTQYSFNYWFELVSNGNPNQYSMVYYSGGKWWNPDGLAANLPTKQWYTVKIVNNDSIKIYDKSTGNLVHSRSFSGVLTIISLANFDGSTSYLTNLVLKRTINTELIRYANTSGIAEIWANIKNWVSAHIGNGTLTIQKNGTDVTTFSANSSSNATANITVPTKVSDLTNDSGFLTTAAIPSKTSDLTNDSGFITSKHTHTKSDVTDLFNSANTWSETNTFNKPLTLKGAFSLGNVPSANAVSSITFKGTDGNASQDIRFIIDANGETYTDIRACNKFTSGALSPSGSVVVSEFKLGVSSAGIRYIYSNAQWKNNLTPLTNNTYDLGSSSYQWNNVYANAYYLGTTAFGDIVTHNASEFLTSHQSLSNYVTLNSTQTISGNKTFTGGVTLSNTAKMTVNHATIVKGTNPSSTQYWQIFNCDKNGGNWGTNTLSIIEGALSVNGRSSIYFRACKNEANSTESGTLAVIYDSANNKTWAECPTPDANANDTKIATTAWVNSKGYLTSHQSLSNYVTLNGEQTISGNKTFSGTLTGTLTGNCSGSSSSCTGNAATATTATKVVGTVANDNTGALVQGTMGTNDCFRIAIGGAKNAGWAEIATGDDYNEPIYVRQYQGSFATLKRTATLLDASGNTSFPGTVTATGFSGPLTGNVTGNCSGSSGSCTGNAATATKATGNANGKELTNTIIKGLAISGKTITYTQIDGTTGTLTTQDTNTDTLMTQNVSTTNATYPILLCPTANATANQGAKTGIFAKSVKINPKTNTLIASNIQYTDDLSQYKSGYTKGGAFTSNVYLGMAFKDSAGASLADILYFQNTVANDGNAAMFLRVFGNANYSGTNTPVTANLGCGVTKNNGVFTFAPTPATADNSTQIATTAFVKAQGYLTSHQSLSNYSTLANTVKSLSISGKTITVTPGSGKAYTLTTQDTVYTHPTTAGNKHIPSGGSSGQILKYSSSGTAVWADTSFTRQMVSIATDSFDNTLLNRTKAVTLTKSQLAVVTVDLTTVSGSLVKLTASNIFVVAVHTLVGNNVYKQDSVNYGCILQQGAAGRTRVVALIFPYNTSVEFTLAKVSGSVNPFSSYSLTVYQ